jgi:hypothetical protein
MENHHPLGDEQPADLIARAEPARRGTPAGWRPASQGSETAVTVSVDASDGVDEQSEQSFPASDPPSWSGLSL